MDKNSGVLMRLWFKPALWKCCVKVGVLICVLFGVGACEYPYKAKVDEQEGMLSVEGSIVKGDSLQTVIISRSTPLYAPHFNPVADCAVLVEDEFGVQFVFSESSEGVYTCRIPEEALEYGRSYRVLIVTPDGEQYESDFEEMYKGAPVDSVYYEVEAKYNSANEEVMGAQFYLDLIGSESDSRFYRWGLTETWEYQSSSEVDLIIKDASGANTPLDDSYELFYCWKTQRVSGLYSSSTVNISTNQKKKIPLNFVSDRSDRLRVRYSLLVEQYSLSEGAYDYWNRVKIETRELSGLYTQQPGQAESNIVNVNNLDDVVVGYFWVSAKTEKRVFTGTPAGLNPYKQYCTLVPLDYEDVVFPIYAKLRVASPWPLVYDTLMSDAICMDCRLLGGTNVEPDFWE